jgi:hypothetical protein
MEDGGWMKVRCFLPGSECGYGGEGWRYGAANEDCRRRRGVLIGWEMEC